MMLATVPLGDIPPDTSSIRLSNQPGARGESVALDALTGRQVGDMGFGYVEESTLTSCLHKGSFG